MSYQLLQNFAVAVLKVCKVKSRQLAVVDKIIWSDEAQFKLNGMINRWNGVFWSDTNNHHTIEQELNAPGLMVWLGFSSRGLVGPHFFEGKRVLFKFCVRIILCSGNVNQHTYLQMLNELVWPYCQPLGTDVWFEQDGCPAHYANVVRNWLNEHFADRWFGRRGPIEWPARSPDLSPLDFAVWAIIKNRVYSERPRDLGDLRQRIIDACDMFDLNMCQDICRSVPDRLVDCINQNGHQFEHVMN